MIDSQMQMSTEATAIRAIVEKWLGEKKVDLVFQGGGVLGIGLVGAYSELEHRGFRPQNLAGTSAGAIVATLIAVGYTADQISNIIFSQQFKDFTDPVVPLIGDNLPGKVLSVLSRHGVYKGDEFLRKMNELIEASPARAMRTGPGPLTFGDLIYDAHAKRLEHRYKLHVIASDVTGRCMLRLPIDAEDKLGITPNELSVAEAVRMSMSIPLFFVPVRKKSGQRAKASVNGGTHVIVDGGMLSNFPVALFDDDVDQLPEWPTLGVKFVEPLPSDAEQAGIAPVHSLVDYGWALIETMTRFYDRLHLDTHTLARTIGVETGDISGMNFALTDADKQLLFANGQRAARDFLDHQWSFEGYLAAFRLGNPQLHARELVSQEMERAAEKIGLTGSRPVGSGSRGA